MFIYTVETIVGLIMLILFMLVIVVMIFGSIKHSWKHRNCQHEKVSETSACHAICRKCHKNLGFIGTWREKNKAK